MLIISGCSISDPQRGGLIGGLIGLGSGQYEQSTEELETELTKTKSELRKTNNEMELSKVEVESKYRKLVEEREDIKRIIEKTNSYTENSNASDIPNAQKAKVELLKKDVLQIDKELEVLWQTLQESY